jgi:hypothetical protein
MEKTYQLCGPLKRVTLSPAFACSPPLRPAAYYNHMLSAEQTHLKSRFGSSGAAIALHCIGLSPFKKDFLNLEQRWVELARSIEFGEGLDRSTKNNVNPNIKPNV